MNRESKVNGYIELNVAISNSFAGVKTIKRKSGIAE